jgi:chromosome segregation ATPase
MTRWNRQLRKRLQEAHEDTEHPELKKRLERLNEELSETPLLSDDEFDELEKRINGIVC